MGNPSFEHWGSALTDDLRELFLGGEEWPVAPASLAALVDLGMPDDEIAKFFGVDAGKVAALRGRYGLKRAAD